MLFSSDLQGCALGLGVSVSRESRDHSGSRLGNLGRSLGLEAQGIGSRLGLGLEGLGSILVNMSIRGLCWNPEDHICMRMGFELEIIFMIVFSSYTLCIEGLYAMQGMICILYPW